MDANGQQRRPHGTAGRPLSPAKDDRLLLALLSGAGCEEAARRVPCGVNTVRRRLRDPEFKRRLDEERERILRQATDALVAHVLAAVVRLGALVADPDSELALKAVNVTLTHATRFVDLADHGRRLQDIVARLAKLDGGAAAWNGFATRR
jgi:hypothetical protein